MPALTADIAAGTRLATIVTWQDAAIAARYPSARDGSGDPAIGWFDSAADAQAVINQRGSLIGTERRAFAVITDGLSWPGAVPAGLTRTLVDSEHGVNGPFLVSRIELDLNSETTAEELFG